MAGAGITTLLGMGITFIVLILLWFIISIMARAVRKSEKKKEEETASPYETIKQELNESKSAEGSGVYPVAEPEENGDAAAESEEAAQYKDTPSEELVAVIMAAIAAAEGSGIVDNLVVRKIRRVSGPTVTWQREGREECIGSRSTGPTATWAGGHR